MKTRVERNMKGKSVVVDRGNTRAKGSDIEFR